MESLHEEIFFGVGHFFDLLGRFTRGTFRATSFGSLSYRGRVVPIMRPKSDGKPGRAKITLTGFGSPRPGVVIDYRERNGREGHARLDIPRWLWSVPRPSRPGSATVKTESSGSISGSKSTPRPTSAKSSSEPPNQMHRIDRGRRSQGQGYFTAPNPPDGAIITYYVNPKVMADSEASTNGALSESGPPRVQVDILDAEGNLLRRLEPRQAEEGTGVQRLVWDLRHSLYFEPSEEEAYSFVTGDLLGAFVLPGSYRARLKVGDVERSTSIDVEDDPLIAISNEDRRAWHDTLLALDGMFATVKAVLSTAEESKDRLGEIQALLQDRFQPDESLAQQVASIDEALKEVLIAMRGKGERSRAEQPGAPPLAEGVRQLGANIEIATARPTEQQSRLTREVHDKLSRQVETLNGLLAGPVADLYRKLDDDGLRWSAGRPIPLPAEPPR